MDVIDKKNWSAFAVDYFDGTLSKEQEELLFAFLERHPELKEEFERYEPVTLEPEPLPFPRKESLKKKETTPTQNINGENYDSFFVLYHDNELTPSIKKETETFLQNNPHLKGDFERWKEVRLEPDNKIRYPDKEALKKKRRLVPLWMVRTVAAAAFLSGFVLLWPVLFNRPIRRQTAHTAKVSPMPQMTVPLAAGSGEPLLSSRATSGGVRETKGPEEPATHTNKRYSPIPTLPKATFEKELTVLQGTGLKKKGNLNIVTIPAQDVLVIKDDSKKRSPLFKTVAKPFAGIARALAMRKRKKKEEKLYTPPALRLLDGGIAAFNTLTSAGVVTARVYNSEGKLTRYSILGNNWEINRKIKPGQ